MRELRTGVVTKTIVQRSTPVVIVEDEPLYRDLLKLALSRDGQFEVVGDFGDGETALRGIPSLKPRVVIVDIELPGRLHGVELGLQLHRRMSNLNIMLLSNHRDPDLLSSLPPKVAAGWSYLLKKSIANIDVLMRALHATASGFITIDPDLIAPRRRDAGPLAHLTPRQWDVLELIAQGYTNAAIAERLFLTEKSVENQINTLYQQLQIDRSNSSVQPRVTAVLAYLRASSPHTLRPSKFPLRDDA